MKSADFDYQLPEQLIAQKPLKQRQSSRLLVLEPIQQDIIDDSFANFESCVEAGDLLVLNDTRVLKYTEVNILIDYNIWVPHIF